MNILDMETWKPMLSDLEIEIIDNILDKLKPKNCLEWGSGNSTVYFPTVHKEIVSWVGVEHKKEYYELLNDKLPDNSKIEVITYIEDYINYPIGKDKYDFIFIDGLERSRCLDVAMQVISKDGVVLLHDSARKESVDMLNKYEHKILSDGEGKVIHGFFAHRGLALFNNLKDIKI